VVATSGKGRGAALTIILTAWTLGEHDKFHAEILERSYLPLGRPGPGLTWPALKRGQCGVVSV